MLCWSNFSLKLEIFFGPDSRTIMWSRTLWSLCFWNLFSTSKHRTKMVNIWSFSFLSFLLWDPPWCTVSVSACHVLWMLWQDLQNMIGAQWWIWSPVMDLFVFVFHFPSVAQGFLSRFSLNKVKAPRKIINKTHLGLLNALGLLRDRIPSHVSICPTNVGAYSAWMLLMMGLRPWMHWALSLSPGAAALPKGSGQVQSSLGSMSLSLMFSEQCWGGQHVDASKLACPSSWMTIASTSSFHFGKIGLLSTSWIKMQKPLGLGLRINRLVLILFFSPFGFLWWRFPKCL